MGEDSRDSLLKALERWADARKAFHAEYLGVSRGQRWSPGPATDEYSAATDALAEEVKRWRNLR